MKTVRQGAAISYVAVLILFLIYGIGGGDVNAAALAVESQLASIYISPEDVVLIVGQRQVFKAEGRDADGNPCPINNPEWQLTMGSAVITPNGIECTVDATTPGSARLTCREAGTAIIGNRGFYVNPTQLATIEVSPSTVNMNVGEQQPFTATGKTADGGSTTIQTPVWETTGGGTLAPSGTTCTYTATQTGDFTITCREGATDITGTASIHTTSTSQLTSIEVTPTNVNLQVGDQEVFTATGKDQYGNTYPISNPVWQTSGGGTLAPNGTTCTYTATQAGNFTVTCREGATTIEGSATIHTTGGLATIEVSPSTVNMQVGQDRIFTATGKTSGGGTATIQTPVWETSGGGTLAPNGETCTYTATQAGDFSITCREGATTIEGSASIHTTAAPPYLKTIEVSPSSVNMQVGRDRIFTASGKDQYGEDFTIPNPVWETTGGGTLAPNGETCTYTATQAGDNEITCREQGTDIIGKANVHVTVTGVEMIADVPDDFALSQNHPNPFNPATTIQYKVKEPCRVVLKVFDLQGREVATLADGVHPSGFYSVRFDASGLASGMYFYRIRMGEFTAVKKMVLLE